MEALLSILIAVGLAAYANLSGDTPVPPPAPQTQVDARVAPPTTLRIGDPAPPLKYKEWIKGTEVASLEKGHLYVVEFWATWCAPCKAEMPRLSELAKMYDGKVTFISMNVMERIEKVGDPYPYGHVERFVHYAGDVMAYNVAADTEDGFMKGQWVNSSGVHGIPFCVIVGTDGNVAWMGNPIDGLEDALKAAIDGTLTKEEGESITKQAFFQDGQGQGLVMAMDEALKDPTQAKTAAFCADEAMKMNSFYRADAVPGKYMALYVQDQVAAKAYAESAIRDKANGPFVLLSLAHTLTASDNPHPDFALAKEAMDATMAYSDPMEPALYPIRALVAFKNGDSAQAVALQKVIVQNEIDLLNTAKTTPNYFPESYTDEKKKSIYEKIEKIIQQEQDTLKKYEGKTPTAGNP